jgi:Anti-sigma factor NepR
MADEKKQVNATPNSASSSHEVHALSPIVQEEIGRRLRAVYGKIAAEPLPEKFSKLLEELAKSDAADAPDRESEA